MQVDPDELLKTKGNGKRELIDPDDRLKTKGLRTDCGEAGMLLKEKELESGSQEAEGLGDRAYARRRVAWRLWAAGRRASARRRVIGPSGGPMTRWPDEPIGR